MIVGSILENKDIEKRIAITPDIIKKYKSLGLQINLPKDYGLHLGISDNEFQTEGANILSKEDEVILSSNAILQMNIPSDGILDILSKDQILIKRFGNDFN